MNYDTYSEIPLSVEVREFLAENEKEWKRQKDRIYQYGVIRHAFDVEERSPGNPGGATCDPIYAVTRAQKLSAEKAFFRQEARGVKTSRRARSEGRSKPLCCSSGVCWRHRRSLWRISIARRITACCRS